MGPAEQSVERELRIAALALIVAWLLNISTTFADHGSARRVNLASWLLIALGLISWIGLLLRILSRQWFIALLAVSSIGQLMFLNVMSLPGAYLYLTSVINSVVVVTAVILPRRVAVTIFLSVIGMAVVLLALYSIQAGFDSEHWRYIVIAGYYALADGMAVSYATNTLRVAAAGSDRESEEISRQLAFTNRLAAERKELERVGRLLHDTVVNTLGAIRRGVAPEANDQLKLRCRLDLERIEQFRTSNRQIPEQSFAAIVERIQSSSLGLGLQLETRGDPSLVVSSSVARGIGDAVTELLINIAKHAGNTKVLVEWKANDE